MKPYQWLYAQPDKLLPLFSPVKPAVIEENCCLPDLVRQQPLWVSKTRMSATLSGLGARRESAGSNCNVWSSKRERERSSTGSLLA